MSSGSLTKFQNCILCSKRRSDSMAGTQHYNIPLVLTPEAQYLVAEVNTALAACDGALKTVEQSGGGGSSADGEIPQGTENPLVFTLQNAPSPASSLKLYVGGLRQMPINDFTLSNNQIAFIQAPIGNIQADYRY